MKTWDLGYKKAKEKARKLYSQFGAITCPAFKNELISFTSEGFNHLIRKGRIPRTKNEQKRRFVLLPYIKQILTNPKAKIFYERRETRYVIDRHGIKTKVQSVADFWTFEETINQCRVKVVIRQLATGGPKHFMSVMGDTIEAKRKHKRRKPKSPRRAP